MVCLLPLVSCSAAMQDLTVLPLLRRYSRINEMLVSNADGRNITFPVYYTSEGQKDEGYASPSTYLDVIDYTDSRTFKPRGEYG